MKELFYLLALAGGIATPDIPKPIIHKVEVVKFSAVWCGPCAAFAPAYDSYAKKYQSDSVKFYSIDIDRSPELTRNYHVESVPTTVIVIDGKEAGRVTGSFGEDFLKKYVAK